jgi:protein SCO1/2
VVAHPLHTGWPLTSPFEKIMNAIVRCSSCGREVPRSPSDSRALQCPACGAPVSASDGDAGGIARGIPPSSSLTALKIWLSILLLGLAAYGGVTLWRIYARQDNVPPVVVQQADFPVGEFELTERSGRPFNSKELLGQIWVVSFFFGSCPSECPMLNNRIADLIAGELADEPVKFVSISVDPKIDTPQRLTAYADVYLQPRKIDPGRWLFLTQAQGSDEVVGAISQGSFHVPFARATHWMKLILVDQQGYVRGNFSNADPVDLKRLKKKIQELHQRPPAAKEAAKEAEPLRQ